MDHPKDRLRDIRRAAGFATPSDASRAFKDINKNTLTSHENGNREISRKAAEKYAKLFGSSAGYILFGDEEERVVSLSVPLLSMVSAGNLRDQDGVSACDVERYINVGDLPKGDWIALQVDGDSMDRIAPDGSIILVDRSDDKLIDGRYYVFSIEGGAATFKKYKRTPQRMQPFSTNPDHMSTPIDGDLYIFGRVRRVITEL